MNKTITILFLLLTFSAYGDNGFYALFSPHQGKLAFETIYKSISSANKKVYLTVYSWSDKAVKQALLAALANGVEVKIILHPSLSKKKRVVDYGIELEAAGAELKIAKMNMHEKFLLIDDEFLMNSSANLSGGAKRKYSENFIFHTSKSVAGKKLIREFSDEFAILWNGARDVYTHGEGNASKLKIEDLTNLPKKGTPTLYSSSMNFTISNYKEHTAAFKSGKYIRLKRRGKKGSQTWKVTSEVISHIDNATTNIYLSLNHLNIRAVSDALIRAVKRGVEVKLTVDNQEYKNYPNGKEMSPQFVKDWKAIKGNKSLNAPVRVKYYSHAPSPRYWYLNHHKFLIVDFNSDDLSKTTLISGSHNLSRTAEHNQFDNMVFYKGEANRGLITSFKGEFNHLWSLKRTAEDLPIKSVYEKLVKPYKDAISLHSNEPISLTWAEVRHVKVIVRKLAPDFFKNAYKKRDCKYFGITSKSFYGCPKKK